ncbi:CBS domain-containing protein [Clostridium acidisoli DSM 12555]|uniref:CBS domain-containing protein n=1 Tax=Clostridium acidisoli DSM 12555 TaxID=1121291 RepID=A0A1W1XLL6_9CLOT|nr:CBS domain-containing protein [Clostridium acidisoli]SMC24408.1 CBS domain-containing protein [Clostridium acidisoli DSM 12555]
MKVREIMHTKYFYVDENETLNKTLQLMNEKGINGVPVVNENLNLNGIVVKADIYRFLVEDGHYDTYPVKSVMSDKVISANEDEEVEEVARRLRENDIMALPVVENKKVIGIIELEDIVDYFLGKN